MYNSGYDNNPNSIFRASKTVKKIINKQLKKEQDANQRYPEGKDASQDGVQQGLKPIQTSNVETDVNKNLSLFTLDIKQLTTLIDAFVDFINGGYFGGSNSGKKKKQYSRKVERTNLLSSSSAVRGTQLHSAPVSQVNNSDNEDSDESNMWNRDIRTLSGDESSSTGRLSSNYGSSDSESDADSEIPSQIGDYYNDDLSSLTEPKYDIKIGKKNINLVRELARISNLVQHAFSLWDDSISPNILYLSKIKMSNFLNSNIIKDFEHSIEGFDDLFSFGTINNKDYPELYRVFVNTNDDLDNLFKLIEIDIKKVSGINTGSVKNKPPIDPRTNRPYIDPITGKETTNVDRATERTYTGAGFLHFPSPYNNYMHHTKTKYLM